MDRTAKEVCPFIAAQGICQSSRQLLFVFRLTLAGDSWQLQVRLFARNSRNSPAPKTLVLNAQLRNLASIGRHVRPPLSTHLDAHLLFVDRCNHCGSSLSLLSRSAKSLISCRPSAGSLSLVFYRNFGVPSELCRQINLIRFTAQIELSDCLDFCIICVYAGRARERERERDTTDDN